MTGSNGGRFVAVHLRWLEGKCMGRANDYYIKSVAAAVGLMCSTSYKLVNKIVRRKGLDLITMPLFVASDRQRQDADRCAVPHSSIQHVLTCPGVEDRGKACTSESLQL